MHLSLTTLFYLFWHTCNIFRFILVIKVVQIWGTFVCIYLLVLHYVGLECLCFLRNSSLAPAPPNKPMGLLLSLWLHNVMADNPTSLPTGWLDIPFACHPSEILSSWSSGRSLTLKRSASLPTLFAVRLQILIHTLTCGAEQWQCGSREERWEVDAMCMRCNDTPTTGKAMLWLPCKNVLCRFCDTKYWCVEIYFPGARSWQPISLLILEENLKFHQKWVNGVIISMVIIFSHFI